MAQLVNQGELLPDALILEVWHELQQAAVHAFNDAGPLLPL